MDVYRDDRDGVIARGRELAAEREARRRALDPSYRLVYARRVARAVAGLVAVGGAILMAGLALDRGGDTRGEVTTILLSIGPAALLAAFVAGRVARAVFDARLRRALALTGDPYADLERLARVTPEGASAARADRLEVASVALPLAGIGLALPLTLHAAVAFLLGTSAAAFDAWVRVSVLVVGHAHVTVALLGWRFARRLRRWRDAGDPAGLPNRVRQEGWGIYGWTVFVSAVPGALLIGIPPLIVAMTGLVLPPIVVGVVGVVLRERERLGTSRGPSPPDGLGPTAAR